MSKTTNRIFGPDAPDLLNMGQSLYNLFEPLIEEAPATSIYDELLRIDDTTPFYEVKERLKWFALESYTVGVEFSDAFKEKLSDFVADEDGIQRAMHLDQYAYAVQDEYLYANNSSFSALSTLEWFAGIAKCSPELKTAIINLKQRLTTQLSYEGETSNYWLFRQLQTDEVLKIVKPSVSLSKPMRVKGYMQLMTIVKWKKDWWMSGITMGFGQISDAKKEKMKKDIVSIPFYAYSEENQQKLRSATDDMYHYFVEYFGSAIVIFKNKQELKKAMQDQQAYYNKKRVIDKEAGAKAQENYDEKYNNSEKNIWKDLDFDAPKGIGLVFIPRKGNLIDPDIANVIAIMKAPAIDKEGEKFLFNCLIGEDTHEFITDYLLENYPTHNFKFPIAASKIDVLREAKFLMRFLNPQEFKEPIPLTKHTPSGVD